ncbi:hypothetical protein C3B59_10495 [Cryobacterium zongtaii]|uniref:Uncharacterized protein n=2 Tax=Cryobacterium zongtaii TaxID=1259217 RepID=A0A2S3ZCI0_9MICO|nr:hypothetical protein C3B59_10495 [Cryobacterium zongtaii]
MGGTYYRNADTGTVAVFGPDYAMGRQEFATDAEYQLWRQLLAAESGSHYVPPADSTAITALGAKSWAIVCVLYGPTPEVEEIP